MTLQIAVLGSGSAGNASLVGAGEADLLVDLGLGPRQLAERLSQVGHTWSRIGAAVLTHTHSDHWNDRTLAQLVRRRVTLYCHAEHHGVLHASSPAFAALVTSDLVRRYEAGESFVPVPGLRCHPLPVRHDGGATFGFRFDGAPDLFGGATSLAYLTDLGSWDDALADAVTDVDALAVEFNHDVALEYASGRSMRLISRVLGDEGHLSNDQAAAFLRAILERSTPSRLRHVIQLHLSRDCNRPHLALASARSVLGELGCDAEVHTATQDEPLPLLHLGAAVGRRERRGRPRGPGRRRRVLAGQPLLPGFESVLS